MNIQIFGTKKSFDSKKAERYFKERGIKYQFIDMKEKGMSKGELNSVKQAVGGLDALIDENCKDKDLLALLKYISDEDKEEKVLDNPQVIKVPVVRNGKKATIGYCPDVWKDWE
ncbi:MAG: arsenate reductase family protein [Ruminococcus flavefaciens]|nr:arsenate reductase family protein [Ruminococcus flavefaciens]